jgi:hypothetical protein
MRPIMPGEKCAVTDEDGKCEVPATMFYFGEGRKAELHVCGKHHAKLVDAEVKLALERKEPPQ